MFSSSLMKCFHIAGVALVVLLIIGSMADPLFAGENDGPRHRHRLRRGKHTHCNPGGGGDSPTNRAPEISLGEAGAAGVLLIGSVLVLTDRMRRRKSLAVTSE